MNPDIYSPEYAVMDGERRRQREREERRLTELHRKAVDRRRKRKRGGKK